MAFRESIDDLGAGRWLGLASSGRGRAEDGEGRLGEVRGAVDESQGEVDEAAEATVSVRCFQTRAQPDLRFCGQYSEVEGEGLDEEVHKGEGEARGRNDVSNSRRRGDRGLTYHSAYEQSRASGLVVYARTQRREMGAYTRRSRLEATAAREQSVRSVGGYRSQTNSR